MSSSRPVSARSTRRQFLGTAAVAAGGLALPYFVPRASFGANDRFITGHIGVRNQGKHNLRGFITEVPDSCRVGALCDVDTQVLSAAKKITDDAGLQVELFDDYRRLLDRKDIDAVVISTPDHWHARMTIDAVEAGKDVYCEKPLTHHISEGRQIVDATRRTGRVVQTGSHQRSHKNFHQGYDLVKDGQIGKVQTIFVGLQNVNFDGKRGPDGKLLPNSNPPAELNYDRWLGPAPQRPYNVNHVHYNFRFFWDYSGGQMTNWGAHHIDIAQWYLGMQESGPVKIEAEKVEYDPKQEFDCPTACLVTFTYSNGVKLVVGQNQPGIGRGVAVRGDKGVLFVNRRVLASNPDSIVKQHVPNPEYPKHEWSDHYKNFAECMKTRATPRADVEIGHRSATVCHLGNIACRLGRTIEWDPQQEKIHGDAEAQAMTTRADRKPYDA